MIDALREQRRGVRCGSPLNILDWLSPEEATATLLGTDGAIAPFRRAKVIRQLNSTLDIPASGPMFAWDVTTALNCCARDRSFLLPGTPPGPKAMNILCITAAPEPDIATALARFEEQFTCFVGRGGHSAFRTARITRVSSAPSPVMRRVLSQSSAGEILGVLCLAIARLRTAEGTACNAVYLGDLKIAPAVRGGRVLIRLARSSHVGGVRCQANCTASQW